MNYEQKLNELAARFGSDKLELGYMPLYAEHFNRFGLTQENVKNVLEIGTNKGSSLRIWAEFFTNANVHGIDITRVYEDPNKLNHPRIYTHLVNQGSKTELESFTTFGVKDIEFDLIIDDGSHDQYDQQLTLGMLFGKLRRGGLYVIEDLITGENWWDADLYNKRRVRPTKALMQEFEQTGRLPEDFLNGKEIESQCAYCEFRQSSAIIYERHHPQIAFIAKTCR
jgi:hypothetical protein